MTSGLGQVINARGADGREKGGVDLIANLSRYSQGHITIFNKPETNKQGLTYLYEGFGHGV
jgi:hypothetical protein